MFQFLEELCEVTGSDARDIDDDFKVVMLGNNILYVSNFIKILSYDNTNLSLKIKDNIFNVEGYKLSIKQLSGKEIIVKGYVNRTYLSKEITNA